MTVAMELLSELVMKDGRTWGESAYDWQSADAAAVLDLGQAQRLHFWTRPRGGSKTGDAAGIAIAWLLSQAPAVGRCYVVASDAGQAGKLLEAVQGYLRRTPEVASVLELQSWRLLRRDNGAAVEIIAADGPGAYGGTPDLTIVDEIAQWGDTRSAKTVWTAIYSAVPKSRTARLLILTSAGDPTHWSYRILEKARTDTARWRVHELPGPVPWISEDDLEGQRGILLPSEFAQLHMNEWAASEDRLVSPEDLAACVVLDGRQPPQQGVQYVIGLDLAYKNDNAVAAVCHLYKGSAVSPVRPDAVWLRVGQPLRMGDLPAFRSELRQSPRTEPLSAPQSGGCVVLDEIQVWTPMKGQPITLDVVEDWVRDASSRFNHAGVVFDPFQAIGMAQRLVASGVRCEQFNFSPSSIGRLAALMYRQLHDHAFALPDDESLLRELSRVRFRQTAPGLYRMDHDSNGHDDRAVALALAAQWLLGDGNAFAGLPVLAKPSREERNLLADFPMMTEQQLLDMGA